MYYVVLAELKIMSLRVNFWLSEPFGQIYYKNYFTDMKAVWSWLWIQIINRSFQSQDVSVFLWVDYLTNFVGGKHLTNDQELNSINPQ